MKREELLQSKEYWIAKLQIELFNAVEAYMKANNLNRKQFADKLGVSKGYVSQILNGDADHRMSKFIELSLSIGLVPEVSFEKLDEVILRDKIGYQNISYKDIEHSKNILHISGYLFSHKPVADLGVAYNESDTNWTVLESNKNNNISTISA